MLALALFHDLIHKYKQIRRIVFCVLQHIAFPEGTRTFLSGQGHMIFLSTAELAYK